MAQQIESARGTGYGLEIDAQNRALTLSVTEPEDFHINQSNGKVWSIPFEGLNPAGADDYVVYIKNTGSKNLRITDVRIMADTAATQVEINVVTGTATGGSDITPVARNLGSSETPTATIQSGTDIGGLTSAGTLFFLQCDTVNREYHLRTTSNIIIPKSKAVGLLVETATANVTGVISLLESE